MKLKYCIKERNLIVRLKGDLDHHNAKVVRGKIDLLVEVNNIKNIIFDFEEMEFMDSSGIGLIMGRYKNLKLKNGNVYVSNINKKIDRIFNLSGIYKIIDKYEDVEKALQAI